MLLNKAKKILENYKMGQQFKIKEPPTLVNGVSNIILDKIQNKVNNYLKKKIIEPKFIKSVIPSLYTLNKTGDKQKSIKLFLNKYLKK